ncbi:MAG: hypothetical protein EZS28_027162 [Streblomastix strix]|uniref:Rhodanese domain-containing protein n=1 Tax=Streblomastix strix TaxID=222440 RepID=A0A5J4V4G4_9EUKA|nr:MAG: hypothetical protein EZS28_027162 [Streblomastix strix]
MSTNPVSKTPSRVITIKPVVQRSKQKLVPVQKDGPKQTTQKSSPSLTIIDTPQPNTSQSPSETIISPAIQSPSHAYQSQQGNNKSTTSFEKSALDVQPQHDNVKQPPNQSGLPDAIKSLCNRPSHLESIKTPSTAHIAQESIKSPSSAQESPEIIKSPPNEPVNSQKIKSLLNQPMQGSKSRGKLDSLAKLTPEEEIQRNKVDPIDPAELANILRTDPGSVIVADVRDIDYYGYKVKGSRNIPNQLLFSLVPGLIDEIEKSAVRPSRVVFYCQQGLDRSPDSAHHFRFKSYIRLPKLNVFFIAGGFNAWKELYQNEEDLVEEIE